MIFNEEELIVLRENAKVHKEVVEEIKKMAKVGVSGYDINKLC
jgi:methionine aminopeptidase